MQFSVALHFEADPLTVPKARHLLLATLHERGADEDLAGDLAIALTEACTNAVAHAGATGYKVSWTITRTRCEIEVLDEGGGFTIEDSWVMPSADAVGGRGLALIDTLVDNVSVEAAPGQGTAIRMQHEL
jgi:serine/threonine-protein kinase RsbW